MIDSVINATVTICNMFLIAWLCVFIIDCSGAIEELQRRLKRVSPLYRVGKPLSCSLCMTWWLCLLYLLCIGNFTLGYVAIAAFWAIMTGELGSLIKYIQSRISRAIIRADERDEYRTATPRLLDNEQRRKIGY